MKIIGLGHYSRTGKDTVANSIIASVRERFPGYRIAKRPFAWKLKQIAHELYSWAGLQGPEFYDIKENEYLRDIVLPELGKTPVEIWIAVGNLFRENIHKETWVAYVLQGITDLDAVVVPDVRFPNEIEAIQSKGGLTCKVIRPGFKPRDSVSDRALLGYMNWDYVAGLSGQMHELHAWGEVFAHWIVTGNAPQQSNKEKESALKAAQEWETN